jgi:hypothetical protein
MSRPAFLITIDTEGDDLWSKPATPLTRNAEFLPRFQELCERHGMKPTYLTNHEMARAPAFVELARDALRRGSAEVGLHVHAWDSPPMVPLTDQDHRHHPYLIEFPADVMRAKIRHLTDLLQTTFDSPMRSHRSGRWAFNETYARMLYEEGYRVDCSVTPHVSWRHHAGAPGGNGGSDYTAFPERAYFLDLDDVSREGSSDFLEVPMTIRQRMPHVSNAVRGLAASLPKGSLIWNKLFIRWLRPNGSNRRSMLRLIDAAASNGEDYVEFMLHSSEFMPAGNPTFADAAAIDRLYDDLDALFEHAAARFTGMTLTDYYERRMRARIGSTPSAPRGAHG